MVEVHTPVLFDPPSVLEKGIWCVEVAMVMAVGVAAWKNNTPVLLMAAYAVLGLQNLRTQLESTRILRAFQRATHAIAHVARIAISADVLASATADVVAAATGRAP